MEKNIYRKNSGLKFTPKTPVKNFGQIPSRVAETNIFRDIQNVRRGSMSLNSAAVGNGQHSSARIITLDGSRSQPVTNTEATNNSSIYKSNGGRYSSMNSFSNPIPSVSGLQKKSSTSLDSPTSTSTFTKLLETVMSKLQNIEDKNSTMAEGIRENNQLLRRLLRRQEPTAFRKPDCFPFESTEDLIAFNEVSEEKYLEVVNFLSYLGGLNATDCAANYIRHAFSINPELLSNITWTGSKKTSTVAMAETRFVAACEEAMGKTRTLVVPVSKTDFSLGMNKAIKSIKEKLRRKTQEQEVQQAKRMRIENENRIMQESAAVVQQRAKESEEFRQKKEERRQKKEEPREKHYEPHPEDAISSSNESDDLFNIYN